MGNDNTKPLGRVIGIDEGRIERHVSELARGSVEKTLNELLDARLSFCRAGWRRRVLATRRRLNLHNR